MPTSGRSELIKALKDLQHIQLNGIRFRLIDAKGMIVGRLAIEIAKILQGKDKPTYNPKHNMGDVVVVINAAHVHFTNDQWNTKLYRWHTGYPGGLRERVASEQWDRDPTSILRNAVKGMLPSNRMRVYRMDKLKIFPDEAHPYQGLELIPYVPAQRKLYLPGLGWPLPAGMQPLNQEKYAFRAVASPWLRPGSGHGQEQEQKQLPLQQGSQGQAGGQEDGHGAGEVQQAGQQGDSARQRQGQKGKTKGGKAEPLGLAGFDKLLTPEEKAAWLASSNQQLQAVSSHQ